MTGDANNINLKETLLMPKTSFPMKANLPIREPKMQGKWEKADLENKIREKSKGKELFILHDGPPYANGDLHMGHALNKILKDFIVRYRTLRGNDVPFVPGWDTHGLPIETALVKKEKINRKKMEKSDFRARCQKYALKQVDRQKEQFQRLGLRGDWNNPYITLNPEYVAEQIGVFGEMANKGYIYKGLKPVYWSPSSESALAEAEIEYQDKTSTSIYVTFTIIDGMKVVPNGSEIVIWTTTPWTIPGNMGIAVNYKVDYAVVEVNSERTFLVAETLVSNLATILSWKNYTVIRVVKGSDLENIKIKHPFYNRESIVMCGEHVTTESGTGCVHTAPGHGEDDFYLGQKYNLEVFSVVNEKGVMNDNAPQFTGTFYEEASQQVIETLRATDALLFSEMITHSYPHDWRTKKPTIFRATSQWFASISDFREDLLKGIESTKFVPSWGQKRLFNMIRDRDDWCISRQRAWGVPIPVFYGEDGSIIITREVIKHLQELFRIHGSNIWFEKTASELLPPNFKHESSPNGVFTKEVDIMDVWFDSGSSHQAVLQLRQGLKRPADLYLEGSDQYRGWFNSSLATAVAITGKPPYKQVLSHGFVLDGAGRKMSKSLGNTILPAQIAQKYGVDVMRLWVASVNYQSDVRISDNIINQVAEVYRKIRNTFRFLLGNLSDFDPEDLISYHEMADIHKLVILKLNNMLRSVTEAYNNYDFSTVFQEVNQFCTVDLSAFYLDVSKDILYCDVKNSINRRSFQTVFHHSIGVLVHVLAPILPHTVEEVWENIQKAKCESVHLSNWPDTGNISEENAILSKWEKIFSIREHVLKVIEVARTERNIGKSLNAKLVFYANGNTKRLLESVEISLEQLFIVSEVRVDEKKNAPETSADFDEYALQVEEATGITCERCWNIRSEVEKNKDNLMLCKRCQDVFSAYKNKC